MRQHVLASTLNPNSRSPSPQPLTHVEEQEALRKETIAAFRAGGSDDSDEEDNLLVPREKTKDEIEQEEEEYREYLQREVGEDLKGLITLDKTDTGNDASDEAEGSADAPKPKKKSKKKEDVDNSIVVVNSVM